MGHATLVRLLLWAAVLNSLQLATCVDFRPRKHVYQHRLAEQTSSSDVWQHEQETQSARHLSGDDDGAEPEAEDEETRRQRKRSIWQQSRFECDHADRDEHRVCVFSNLVIYRNSVIYLGGGAERLPLVHMLLRPEWNDPAWLRLKVWNHSNLPSHLVHHTEVSYIDSAYLYWIPKGAGKNFHHMLGEFLPSMHAVICRKLGKCHYPRRAEVNIINLNNDMLPFPSGIHDAIQCLTSHPIHTIHELGHAGKAVIIKHAVVGVGPHCRCHAHCTGDDRGIEGLEELQLQYGHNFHTWGRTPIPQDYMQTWRQRLGECLNIDLERAASTNPVKLMVINRPQLNGRSLLNIEAIIQHLSERYPNAELTLQYLEGLTLREQALVYNAASVVVQMHGASMANWVFLPRNGVAVHIAHQGKYKALHGQADHLVRDLSYFGISYVPVTNTDMNRVHFIMDVLQNIDKFKSLSQEEKDNLLRDKDCPTNDNSYLGPRFWCIIHWTHSMVNLDLDMGLLDPAVDEAFRRLADAI